MRDLHAVASLQLHKPIHRLKKAALLFDKIHLTRAALPPIRPFIALNNEIDSLEQIGLIERFDPQFAVEAGSFLLGDHETKEFKRVEGTPAWPDVVSDIVLRRQAALLAKKTHIDTVPICAASLPQHFETERNQKLIRQDVFQVVLEAFPMPDEQTSWDDIRAFKEEQHGKLWGLRRFLLDLASKKKTVNEIRDEIGWTVAEYTKAMQRRRMSIVYSSLAAFIIPVATILDEPTGGHFAQIIAGVFALYKMSIDLLEVEANAPGREFAYLFETQKTFG